MLVLRCDIKNENFIMIFDELRAHTTHLPTSLKTISYHDRLKLYQDLYDSATWITQFG